MHCRGAGQELAPYADVYPAATRPSAAPFSAQALRAAFQLEAGTFSLPEVLQTSVRGIHVARCRVIRRSAS